MENVNGLDKIILEAISDGAFPGANYAIVTKSKVTLGSLGNKALYPMVEKNSVDTLYDMASVSKVLSTTTCIMKLIEMGKLRLHSKVQSFLPRFRFPNLTIWDLMTHTSGMRECLKDPCKTKTLEEAWDKLYSYDLEFTDNQKIVYSDLNYIMLGEIVHVVSGKTLPEFAGEYVFKPLEMFDTGYNPTDKMRCAPTEKRDDETYRGIVRGDVHDETSYIMGGTVGHAGVFSTVSDMSHFIEMILNRGEYHGKRILAPQTVDLLFEVQVTENDPVINRKERRGLGWIIKGQASSAGDLTSYDDTILHTGFTGTNVWIDRKNGVGFCMLTNRVHPTRGNGKHIEVRPRVANYVMAHLEDYK